ncbi:MAG: DMT family transporter [Anaerolineae bacterium]|nr:DMT family transporter [Anaerolineae bacterium]
MHDFTGELAALGTALCFAFGSTLFTLAGREMGAQRVNRVRLLVAAVLVAIIHWLTFGQLVPPASAESIGWLVLSGFVGLVLGDICLMQAFVMLGPRLSMLVMALAPMIATIIAWIFLDETLDALTLAGIALAVGGVILVVAERPNGGATSVAATGRAYQVGLLFAFGGALGQAGGTVLSRLGLAEGLEPLSASLIRLTMATVVMWGIALAGGRVGGTITAVREHPRARLRLLGGAVVGPVIGVWLSLVAVQRTSVGIASTLISLTPIFLIPISYVVFKERATRQAVIGTVIAFAGTALLFA